MNNVLQPRGQVCGNNCKGFKVNERIRFHIKNDNSLGQNLMNNVVEVTVFCTFFMTFHIFTKFHENTVNRFKMDMISILKTDKAIILYNNVG